MDDVNYYMMFHKGGALIISVFSENVFWREEKKRGGGAYI
jgi:hypothetical protein